MKKLQLKLGLFFILFLGVFLLPEIRAQSVGEALDFDGNAEDKVALINILIPDCIIMVPKPFEGF